MQLSVADLVTQRKQPQSSELFLSIFSPAIAMTGLITGSYAKGAMEIDYTPISGSYLSVEAGQTVWVGTSYGAKDLGKIRLRAIDSSTISVAENSHIDWANAQYLTVLRYWELWPVYPRIISDPNNDEDVIFYKDYDIAYTDQNSILGTFICAGPHRAGLSGDNLYWSSSGTYNLLEENLTYEWAFEGGTPTGSTSAVPGNVQYNTPGHYVTRLKVTDANGTVDTSYRYVSIYAGASPIKNWNISNLSGSREEGGYSATIEVVDEEVTINDGDVVVLWSNDWYGNENRSIGGNAHGNQKIFFSGHVLDGSIRYNYRSGVTSFQVGSITELMKRSEGFSISVESKPSPGKWFELLDMDGRRALFHYLKWQSTMLSIADFRWNGQDQKIQYFDADRESLFDAIDNYMRGTLLGSVCADRQGAVWAEVGAWAVENPTGTFPTIMNVQKLDWMNEPSVEKKLSASLSYLELGGIAYSGSTTGTFGAFISSAPGQVPHTRGSVERIQGLALSSQDQLNSICGNVYANRNAKNQSISMDMGGNYRNLDIAPQESLQIDISQEDAYIDASISAPFLLNSVAWSYDSANKSLLNSIGLLPLLNGTQGDTVSIPDTPVDDGYGGIGSLGFGGGLNFGAFPPILSSLNTTQLLIRARGNAGGGSTIAAWREINFNTIDINYGFNSASGTSSYNTGTYVSGLYAPYHGIYLLHGEAGFTSIAGTVGIMALSIDDVEYGIRKTAAYNAGYGAISYSCDSTMLAEISPGQKISMLVASNSSFVFMSAAIDIVLLARLE